MLVALQRRISKLEKRHPAQGLAQMLDTKQLDPAVLALWCSVGVDQMTLAQLALLEADLRRFTV
jgi:hypothetical protein